MKNTYRVIGMTCASCMEHVSKQLESLNGIKNVSVNLIKNQAVIEYDESIISFEIMKKSLNNIGYDLSSNLDEENKNNNDLLKIIISSILLVICMYIGMGEHLSLNVPKIISKTYNPFVNAIIQLVLIIPIIILNFRYFTSGYSKLFHKIPNMDSLIAIGSTSSLIYGIFCIVMIGLGISEYKDNLYIDSSGMILTFVSIGKYLESKSKKKTSIALEELIKLRPNVSRVIKNKEEVIVDSTLVNIGDIIIVKAGEQIPLDGIVIDGSSSVNDSSITGESKLKSIKINDTVYSSSIVLDGYLLIKVTSLYIDSVISNIIKLVEESSSSKAPIEKLVDKIAYYFVPSVFIISIITLIIGLLVSKDFESSFNNAITVLVISCPCALGLATPVAIMCGTGKGAREGILIRNAEILEKTRNVNLVVFDKTGTLTKGDLSVKSINILDNTIDVLGIINSIESLSNHPISKSLCDYCRKRYAKSYKCNDFENIPGYGVSGVIDGNKYFIGNYSNKINNPIINKSLEYGYTTLVLLKNDELLAVISLSDEIKESAYKTINELKKRNIEIALLSGDDSKVCKNVCTELGIDNYYGNLLPSDKLNIIKNYQEKGYIVSMVGDGVNDAPALNYADVGIAVGKCSDISASSSDIVILKDNLLDVVNAILLSKKVNNKIIGNLLWAFLYNVFAIIISTGLLSSFNIAINPMIGSIAMSISSLFVVSNALTINLFKPLKLNNVLSTSIFKVGKMMCTHCEQTVEKLSQSIPNIKYSKANYKTSTLELSYNGECNVELLSKILLDNGYELKERIK